jgi:D-alanyl-D-alanine carboxypeptidase (penicillin-binding protein 5/6)
VKATRRSPRRSRWPWIVFAAILGAIVVAAATFVAVRLAAPLPAATVSINAPTTIDVDAGTSPQIPVPEPGSFALATSLDGTVATHDATTMRPIGSVAKAMTALVVLGAHPLAPGASGPSLTMTAADVARYRQARAEGGSTVPVYAGEVLTERDLLLALLLPSANNIAETLAVWVSGNRTAFIDRLNAAAVALGMHDTHFADPSGFSTQTQSTAADLVVLARAVIANAALAELVTVRSAQLPDGTVLTNLDVLLDKQTGWLGIKTGWTGAAGGCLLFAARQTYAAGESMTVWGAILDQPAMTAPDPAHPELGAAFAGAQTAVNAAFNTYTAVDLAQLNPQVTGDVSTAWGAHTDVLLDPGPSDLALVRAGTVLHVTTTLLHPALPLRPGATVARVTGALNAHTSVTWDVVSDFALGGPSFWWKVLSA